MNLLAKKDLRVADILMYRCPGLVPRLTRELDGGGYSHASFVTSACSVFDGATVIEATRRGIEEREMSASLEFASYVDVYRFRGKDGTHIGDRELPEAPLLESFRAISERGACFISDPNLLLGVAAMRRSLEGGEFGSIVEQILEAACDSLAGVLASMRHPILSSELIYRGFAGAGPRYQLRILASRRRLIESMTERFGGADRGTNESNDPGFAAYEHFFARYQDARSESFEMVASPSSFDAPHGEEPGVEALTEFFASFISPKDLETSPSLWFVGRQHVPN